MADKSLAMAAAHLVNRTLLAVAYTDGTEAFFDVDELSAQRPSRHLATENLLDRPAGAQDTSAPIQGADVD